VASNPDRHLSLIQRLGLVDATPSGDLSQRHISTGGEHVRVSRFNTVASHIATVPTNFLDSEMLIPKRQVNFAAEFHQRL
jgi:hypothetical protein